MFDLLKKGLEDAAVAAVSIANNAFDMSLHVISCGHYGKLDKSSVQQLVRDGVTIYELSELSGIAVSTLREWAEVEEE